MPKLEEAPPAAVPPPTMREMMEIHRKNPDCRGCHARMDPIGLGLENFNALGQFRASEHGKPIDTGGQLLTGEKFSDVAELKEILATKRREDFYRCLSEKLLTYAIGRGVEYYDATTIDHSSTASKRTTASSRTDPRHRRKRPVPETPRRRLMPLPSTTVISTNPHIVTT